MYFLDSSHSLTSPLPKIDDPRFLSSDDLLQCVFEEARRDDRAITI
jgi:hypothetical protein